MLQGKRNTNNGNAKNECKNQMRYGNTNASREHPDNIEEDIQTATASVMRNNGSTKRPQNKTCNFKTLQAKWDADNSKA